MAPSILPLEAKTSGEAVEQFLVRFARFSDVATEDFSAQLIALFRLCTEAMNAKNRPAEFEVVFRLPDHTSVDSWLRCIIAGPQPIVKLIDMLFGGQVSVELNMEGLHKFAHDSLFYTLRANPFLVTFAGQVVWQEP